MSGRAAFAALGSPPFRRYTLGQLPSVTCSWVQVVALSWVVVDLDPRALGWVVAAQFLPSLLLGPWFGAVADRLDRRRLLMLAEAGLGLVAALAYAVAAAAGSLTLPYVYLLAMAWGVLNALDTPARRALVPMLVPPAQAANAAALSGTVLLLGMTAGSALGGALVATVGATAAFAVNAVSFLVDVAVLATVRVGPSPRVKRAPHQVRDGLRYVWHTAALREPLLALAVVGTLAFTVQVSVPILMRVSFDASVSGVGAAFTAVTAGSLAGTLVAAARRAPGTTALRQAIAMLAAGMVVTAVTPALPVAIAGLAGVGLAWSYVIASVLAILQTAEPSMLGRVMSLMAVVMLGGLAAGGPIAAAVASIAGPRAPFVLGAVASAAALLVLTGRDRQPAARSLARLDM